MAFCLLKLLASNVIFAASNFAISSKAALLFLPNSNSLRLASNLRSNAFICLSVISCSILAASLKNPILSSAVNSSLLAAFSRNSFTSLVALALATMSSLSILSTLALASAISFIIFDSSFTVWPKFLTAFVALFTSIAMSVNALEAPAISPVANLYNPLPALIILDPRSANMSKTLLTTLPICIINFVNLF